jgi:hypothetical protein
MGREERLRWEGKQAACFEDTSHFANMLMERSDFLFSKLTTYLYSPSPYSKEGYGRHRARCLLSLSPQPWLAGSEGERSETELPVSYD